MSPSAQRDYATRQRPQIAVVPLTAAFAEVASALHEEGFEDCWDADAIIRLLDVPGAFGFLAFRPWNEANNDKDEPLGFVLIQSVLDEAEIVTIVVGRQARQSGVARKLLSAVFDRLRDKRIGRLLLEVAEDNAPAIALYLQYGFEEVGRRKNYYRRKSGREVDALVMEHTHGHCVLGWGD